MFYLVFFLQQMRVKKIGDEQENNESMQQPWFRVERASLRMISHCSNQSGKMQGDAVSPCPCILGFPGWCVTFVRLLSVGYDEPDRSSISCVAGPPCCIGDLMLQQCTLVGAETSLHSGEPVPAQIADICPFDINNLPHYICVTPGVPSGAGSPCQSDVLRRRHARDDQ